MVKLLFTAAFFFLFAENSLCLDIKRIGKNDFVLSLKKSEEQKYIQIKARKNNILILERNSSSIRFRLFGRIDDVVPIEVLIFKEGFIKKIINLDLNNLNRTLNRKDVQILVEVSKQKVRYGDGALIKYSLLSDYQYVNYRVSKFPSYEGFVKRFVDPGNNTRAINFEGRLKYITPLYHVELFPLIGKKQAVYNMEIIVDENTERESLLVSENPRFSYVQDNSFDPLQGISITSFEDVQIEDKSELKREIIFSISGKGLVENIDDIKFKGSAIKTSKLRLYDQKYRPGFGKKSYKAFLEFNPYENSRVDVYIEGKKISSFFVDTFLGNTQNLGKSSNRDSFVTSSFAPSVINYLIIFSFLILIVLFFFGRNFTNWVIIFERLFRLYIKGKIPFNNFYELNYSFFPVNEKNWYLLENLLSKHNEQVGRNIPAYVYHTHDKIRALLEGYRSQNSGISKKHSTVHSIGFFELFRYLVFLHKELNWK